MAPFLGASIGFDPPSVFTKLEGEKESKTAEVFKTYFSISIYLLFSSHVLFSNTFEEQPLI